MNTLKHRVPITYKGQAHTVNLVLGGNATSLRPVLVLLEPNTGMPIAELTLSSLTNRPYLAGMPKRAFVPDTTDPDKAALWALFSNSYDERGGFFTPYEKDQQRVCILHKNRTYPVWELRNTAARMHEAMVAAWEALEAENG